jgi:glycosyltransferase involved in cell wall biosynthesis
MAERSSNRPPRVWLACDYFLKYTAGLAEGLLRQGCEVTLLTRDHGGEFGGDPAAMRAFVAAHLDAGGRQIELGGRIRDLGTLAATARIRRECRRWAPDFVHFQDSLANDPRLAVASGVPARPYALTVHDPVPHPGDQAPPRWTHATRRRLRRHAGLVFVHSELLKEELLALGGIGAPIEVVPHGVGSLDVRPQPAQGQLLFFGRMSYYKGLDVLLDAMATVWERLPELTLEIAGDGTVIDHPVLADPRVIKRFGYVADDAVAGLFAGASCVVLPYRQASQSGVGSLAREYGRAVIASAIGGLPELVGPDWGRLVPPEDPAALAAAIIEVLGTPGRAEEMGKAAAGSLGGSDWEGVAASTLAAYEAHLRRGRRA